MTVTGSGIPPLFSIRFGIFMIGAHESLGAAAVVVDMVPATIIHGRISVIEFRCRRITYWLIAIPLPVDSYKRLYNCRVTHLGSKYAP